MNTEQRITYSVGFKAVIELVAAGKVEFETNDVVAEVIELSDAFYEALAIRQELGSNVPSTPAVTSTPAASRFSTPTASPATGSTKKPASKPKDPNAAASPAQIGFLKKLIGENNVPSDANGFELNGVVYEFAGFTMGSIQEPIEALKS